MSSKRISYLWCRAKEVILSPFTSEFPLFVILFFMTAVPLVCFMWRFLMNPCKDIFILLIPIIAVSFLLAAIVSLSDMINKSVGCIIRWTVFSLSLIMAIADVGCMLMLDSQFCMDFAVLIRGTSASEGGEFFIHYFTPAVWISLLVFAGISVTLYSLMLRIHLRVTNRELAYTAFGLLAAGIMLLCALRPDVSLIKNTVIQKYEYLFIEAESFPDLHEHLTHPTIVEETESKPYYVVVIFGESLGRNHMSLYGYEKDTNPRLKELRDSGLLTVYEKPSCSEISTIAAFKRLMSTYNKDMGDSIKWYDCTTIVEAGSVAGYKTAWISTQNHYGLFENGVTAFADLCDETRFVGDEYGGTSNPKNAYDEVLIGEVKKYLSETAGQKNLILIHMMGSHELFNQRYPADRAVFSREEYPGCSQRKAELLSQYDNSVLYNDSVIAGLMNIFDDREAAVIYLSDHALDVFDVDDEYVGHARKQNPLSVSYAHNIPFMVYTTDKYSVRFPNIMQRLKEEARNEYCSDNLIYTVLDLMGVNLIDNSNCCDSTAIKKRAKQPTSVTAR